ncbi:MAG: hypothetical protein Q8M17_16860 [Actinomycetota bacterium]|nr:hypothetical protein [Actinomycetota bacterium]
MAGGFMTGYVSLVRDFVTGLASSVVIDPVRRGTLHLRGHSPLVVGIGVFVAAVYALLLAAIAAARPLRAGSEFVADTSRGNVSVIPAFLVPLMLFVLGLAFALVLAGSLQAHRAVRATILAVVLAVLGSFVMAVPSREVAGAAWWLAVACLAVAGAYSVTRWWRPGPTGIDFLVLLVLLEATIVAAYRATVLGQASSELRFDIATTALLLTYLALLASPVAFAAGLSAVGVGVSASAWSVGFAGRSVRRRTVLALVVLVGAWQAWVTVDNMRSALDEGLVDWLRHLAGAAVTIALAWCSWHLLAERRRGGSAGPRGGSAASIVERSGRFGLPIGYALNAIVILTALLTMVVIGLSVFAPDADPAALGSVIDSLSAEGAVYASRWLLIVALAVASILLKRRRRPVLAAIAAVDAVVLASLQASTVGAALGDWAWRPGDIGDIGVLVAAGAAVAWLARGHLSRERARFLLLLLVMSALVRQAAILEVPMGFLLSASATGLLVFGLFWSFLTGGSATHEDSRHAPKDRRLLIFLGESVYALAIVAWAVIGKEVDASGSLARSTALAVLTLGTSLVLLTVFQQARIVRP